MWTATQESSCLNHKIFHLPGGPDQRVRYAAMRLAMAVELRARRSQMVIRTGGPTVRRAGSNLTIVYDEVERWWTSSGREQIEALGGNSDGVRDSPVGMALKSRL